MPYIQTRALLAVLALNSTNYVSHHLKGICYQTFVKIDYTALMKEEVISSVSCLLL